LIAIAIAIDWFWLFWFWGKRGRCSPLAWSPTIANKIAQLPNAINVLANAQYSENELRVFLTSLTDDQIDEYCTMWDHSKFTNKNKMNDLVMCEPNIKIVDECNEIIDGFLDKFKTKFGTAFTVEDVGDELKYQKRVRAG